MYTLDCVRRFTNALILSNVIIFIGPNTSDLAAGGGVQMHLMHPLWLRACLSKNAQVLACWFSYGASGSDV